MIYHCEKRYLFVHIQKTGGTSISDALLRHASAQFVSPAHLQLRDLEFSEAKPFVFTVVRNPWERMVSWFEMMNRKGIHNDFSKYLLCPEPGLQTVSFSEFIRRTAVINERAPLECVWSETKDLVYKQPENYLKSLGFNQLDYLIDANGTPCFDEIIRFENLIDDFCAVLAPFHPTVDTSWLKRLNVNPTQKNYREYYSRASDREWVKKLCERDIDHFGFAF